MSGETASTWAVILCREGKIKNPAKPGNKIEIIIKLT